MVNVIETLGKCDCSFDIYVAVPASKSSEFSEKFPRWNSTENAGTVIFYPRTVGTRGAKNILRSLPGYAKISDVRAFLNVEGPDGKCFYSGPFELTTDKRLELIENQLAGYERMVSRLEEESRKIVDDSC